MKNVFISMIILCAQSLSLAQSTSCTLTSGATPLDVINWQERFRPESGYMISSPQFNDKAIIISGWSGQGAPTNYLVPLKRVQQDIIADLNDGVVLPTDAQFNVLFVNSSRFLVERLQSDHRSGPSELVQITKSGSTQEMKSLGVLIAKKTNKNKVTQIIYSGAGQQLFVQNENDLVASPLIDAKFQNVATTFKSTGLIIPDGRVLLFGESVACAGCGTALTIYNPRTLQILQTTGIINTETFVVTLKDTQEKIRVLNDLSTGKDNFWSVEYNGNQKIFLNENSAKTLVLTNRAYFTRENQSNQYENALVGINGFPDGDLVLIKNYPSQQHFFLNAKQVSCNLEKKQITKEEQFHVVLKLKGQAACSGTDVTVEAWDLANQKDYFQTMQKSKWSQSEIDYLLQRMLKQNRISESDVNLIDFVMKSNFVSDYQEVLTLLINKFTLANPNKKLLLVDTSPLQQYKLTGQFKQICISPQTIKDLSGYYKVILLEKAKKLAVSGRTNFNIQNLLYMRDYIQILTPADKDEIASDMGTLLAESISHGNSELRNVFFSTLDWMSTQKVKSLLGLPKTALTDIVTMNEGGLFKVYLIGTDEILNNDILATAQLTRTTGGFFGLGPGYLAGTAEATTKVDWLHGEDSLTSEIKVFKRPSDFVVPAVTGPNKVQLLEDGIYHGLVVIGSNINLELLNRTRDNYLSYLEQNKFTIGQPQEIQNPLEYIGKGISGDGEKIDYMVKEAHSDGDYRNLFSINKKMFMVRATLQRDGYKEIIDLMYHDGSYAPQFISNQMLSDWMKARDAKKGGQFIYLNTSCSSSSKAAAELGAAESSNLVIIASASSVYTFSTDQTNSSYYLFDGIRKMLDFTTIAELIKNNRGVYIFPHQEQYKTSIVNNINKGFDISSKVFKIEADGSKKLYQIESEINRNR